MLRIIFASRLIVRVEQIGDAIDVLPSRAIEAGSPADLPRKSVPGNPTFRRFKDGERRERATFAFIRAAGSVNGG